jgi:hypothetical protein
VLVLKDGGNFKRWGLLQVTGSQAPPLEGINDPLKGVGQVSWTGSVSRRMGCYKASLTLAHPLECDPLSLSLPLSPFLFLSHTYSHHMMLSAASSSPEADVAPAMLLNFQSYELSTPFLFL